jgi:hypothetical protein
MKKSLGFVCTVFLTSSLAFAAGEKFIFSLYGNCLNLAENSFTDQASQNKVFFEAKAAVAVKGNLYLWASHGYFPLRDNWTGWDSKRSFAKDIHVERTLGKKIVSGGLGYYAGYLQQNQYAVRAEIGVCSIRNDIESTISDINTAEFLRTEAGRQTGIGARGNLAVTYGLYQNVFAEIAAGFMYASDKIDDVRSNLGGFHLAVGLGIQF